MERYNHGILRFNDEAVIEVNFNQETNDLIIRRSNDLTGEEKTLDVNFDWTKPRWSTEGIASATQPTGDIDLTGIKTGNLGLAGSPITKVTGHLASGSRVSGLFLYCTSLVTAHIVIDDSLENDISNAGSFNGCRAMETLVLICNGTSNNQLNTCIGCTSLKTADITLPRIRNNFFASCLQFDTLIVRNRSVMPMENANIFNSTKFASGSTGGTLYVPAELISEYQSSAGWSKILGYENNQILPIEGTIYENDYADGTPIE